MSYFQVQQRETEVMGILLSPAAHPLSFTATVCVGLSPYTGHYPSSHSADGHFAGAAVPYSGHIPLNVHLRKSTFSVVSPTLRALSTCSSLFLNLCLPVSISDGGR